MPGRPSCIKCVHYFVTHDPAQPFGCRAMGFKSKQNPASMVFASSGIECQLFKLKKNSNIKKSGGSSVGIIS
ncbi:MAG TPA: uracil-DNA glycosylase [Desulfocapsa sulfexigens]|nr:uracil-DNA glycosylase [Desulfocapsa sulfexigens]